MINHKIAQPSIEVVMGYFIRNLSVIVPLKEFLKSVNIWGSYGQEFSVLFFVFLFCCTGYIMLAVFHATATMIW